MCAQIRSERFQIHHLSTQDSFESLALEVQQGLCQSPRSLPPKYFYDQQGSILFDALCGTEEYYLTRTESLLLRRHVREIVDLVKSNTCVELGAGTSVKTETILSALCPDEGVSGCTYVSIDVCHEALIETAYRLTEHYKNLKVHAIAGEYIPAIRGLPACRGPVLYAFIGSSIGNFTEMESSALLLEVAKKMHLEDHFLIGFDRVKDKKTLERAYDDSEGITARFNLNVLEVLNRRLGADFHLNKFAHHAVYNEKQSQIEMYLVSRCRQEIDIARLNTVITLERDEKVLTEISRKYTKSSIQRLLETGGLEEVLHFEPENKYFSLVLARCRRGS